MPHEQQSTERPTAERITAVVADRVRDLRDELQWSQEDLAAHLRAHGLTRWKRATVVNLERRGSRSRAKGESAGRDMVTVQELLTLSYVLGVNPSALLLPVTSEGTVDLPPVGEVSAKAAWDWLDGRAPLAPGPVNDPDGATLVEFQKRARPTDRQNVNPRTTAGRAYLESLGTRVRTVQELLDRAQQSDEG